MTFALVLALSTTLAQGARADDAPDPAAESYARTIFERAEADMRNTPPDYEAACAGFKKAYEIAHGLGALKRQAVCEEARGRLATALALWVTAAKQPQAADRQAESEKQVAALEAKVGRLRVETASPVAGLSVSVDGSPWPVGEAKPIDAGSHHVVFESAAGEGRRSSQTVEVTVANGSTATVRPPDAKSEASPATPKADPAPGASGDAGSGLRVAGFVVGGLGVVGFVAFGVTGGLVVSTHGELEDACTSHESEPFSGCNGDAPGLVSKGDALNVANGVSLGVGIAALGAAVPLLILGYQAKSSTSARLAPWIDRQTAGLVVGGGF